jgi:uncharacterized repeat protein (TIGR01451 family)
MRKILLAFFILVSTLSYGQVVTIPDSNFKKALVSSICVDTDFNGFADADADLNDDGQIQVSEAEKVKGLFINQRDISNLEGIGNFKNLTLLQCLDNNLTQLTLSNLQLLGELYCNNNQLTSLALSDLPALFSLSIENNQLTQLTLSKLPSLSLLYCARNLLTKLDLSNLPSLKELNFSLNEIEQFDLSDMPSLTTLLCNNNLLSKLTLSNLPALTLLDYRRNKLTQLAQFSSKTLAVLNCSNNLFTKVSISNLPSLTLLYIDNNYINDLTLDLPSLTFLSCNNNQLTSFNSSKLPNLAGLSCESNQLTYLNLSHLDKLSVLQCDHNPLTYLLVKLGNKLSGLDRYSGAKSIKYICTDRNKISFFNIFHENAEINSYCSFDAGGILYTILGGVKFDENRNGCDSKDLNVPNLKYEITEGTISEVLFGNESGNYSIRVQEGLHTIIPSLEKAQFFNITPTSKTITFPNTSDTIIQNFCITPKLDLRQIDITIIPLTPPARPGFNTKYKVIITNKGNQRESGTLNFRYNEALLDYVNADTIPKTKGNGLVAWDFKDLLPFETRSYTVTLKVNKPTDSPAVNAGDVLLLTASILDNIFILENTVVGSYDPNDKTCLEGDKITPNLIDKFVHYLIRFENTGTYAAENVVVKDSIDTSIFDINSLQITDASHRSFTRINDNVVEFIFEDIQLPFDDANNDGYIAFKIKTKPTLKVGNVLKNKANIYFDYNFPIITNEAKTVIANTVNTHNIQADDEISIYPNPAADFFRIDTDAKVSKVDIYDLSGRILQSSISVENQVDIKGLNEGTYIVKVYSERGVRVGKMVKGKM